MSPNTYKIKFVFAVYANPTIVYANPPPPPPPPPPPLQPFLAEALCQFHRMTPAERMRVLQIVLDWLREARLAAEALRLEHWHEHCERIWMQAQDSRVQRTLSWPERRAFNINYHQFLQ